MDNWIKDLAVDRAGMKAGQPAPPSILFNAFHKKITQNLYLRQDMKKNYLIILFENSLAMSLHTPNHWRYSAKFMDEIGAIPENKSLQGIDRIMDDPELIVLYVVTQVAGANPKKIVRNFRDAIFGGVSLKNVDKLLGGGHLDTQYEFSRHWEIQIFNKHQRKVNEKSDDDSVKYRPALVVGTADFKSVFHFNNAVTIQLRQFIIMYGNLPIHIFSLPTSLNDNSKIEDIIKSLNNVRKTIEKIKGLIPSSGGRGKHLIRPDGESITQIGISTQGEKNQFIAINDWISTFEELCLAAKMGVNTSPIELKAPENRGIKIGIVLSSAKNFGKLNIIDANSPFSIQNTIGLNEVLNREISFLLNINIAKLKPFKYSKSIVNYNALTNRHNKFVNAINS